jgi:hypothetical protein
MIGTLKWPERGDYKEPSRPFRIIPEVFWVRETRSCFHRAEEAQTMHDDQRPSVTADSRLKLIHAWQGRVRNPSLTVLLMLELCAIFLAAPLAVKGLPLAITVARLVTLELEDRRG